MRPWRLAYSLAILRTQYDALYPNRSRAYDGTIGDAAHAGTKSDHNPDWRGVVKAIDLTAEGEAGSWLADAARDTLVKRRQRGYVIHAGKIGNPSIQGGRWRPYNGSNPHTHHVHVSVHSGVDSRALWGLTAHKVGPGSVVGFPRPTRRGLKPVRVTGELDRPTVVLLQRWLDAQGGFAFSRHGGFDGQLGPYTVSALQVVLGRAGIPLGEADGVFGARSARALERFLHARVESVPGWYPGLVRALQRHLNEWTGRG